MSRHKAGGFSLLELFIAALVVSMLAVVALVQFSTARQEALDREAKSYLQLLRQAAKAYRQQWNVYPTNIGQVPTQVARKCHTTSWWAYCYQPEGADPWSRPRALLKATRTCPGGTPPLQGRYLEITVPDSQPVAVASGADAAWLTDEPDP